jgi:pilus assembly protein Flp/PilA
MPALFGRFGRDASGATAIEYALIASLIAIAIIVGVSAAGLQLETMYQALADAFVQPAAEEPD